jgi:hypothetical protein
MAVISVPLCCSHLNNSSSCRYGSELSKSERPPNTAATPTNMWQFYLSQIACLFNIFLCLEYKEVNKTLTDLCPQIYMKIVLYCSVFLFSCGIFLWCCRERNDRVNPFLVTVMLGFFYCQFTGVKTHHWRDRVVLHLTKDAVLLGSGSSTFDLFVVHLPCKVLWCSTVLKQ